MQKLDPFAAVIPKRVFDHFFDGNAMGPFIIRKEKTIKKISFFITLQVIVFLLHKNCFDIVFKIAVFSYCKRYRVFKRINDSFICWICEYCLLRRPMGGLKSNSSK